MSLTDLIHKAVLRVKTLGAALFNSFREQGRVDGDERENASAPGDDLTREFNPISVLDRFFGRRNARSEYPPVIMLGHSSMRDEEIYADFILSRPDVGFIISPRSVDRATTERLRDLFGSRLVTLAEGDKCEPSRNAVILIDNPAADADAFRYADITYLGGGFDNSLSRITLAIAPAGRPISDDADTLPLSDLCDSVSLLMGPDYRNDPIAADLLTLGGAQEVSSAGSFNLHAGRLVYDVAERRKRARWSAEYASELLASKYSSKQ